VRPTTLRPSALRSSTVRRRPVRAVAAGLLLAALVLPAAAFTQPDWDQAENIKDAALRLAQMQRTRGATKTFEFIDACYRTHSLSSEYTKAFEACIAQDYLETQILALIYSRLSPEALQRMGAPTPQRLAQTMGRRISSAFAKYKVPKENVETFKSIVDEQFPVFFQALFPDRKVPVPKNVLPQQKQ
jgi:hypothetical protein